MSKEYLFKYLVLTIILISFLSCTDNIPAEDLYIENSKNELVIIYIGSTECAVCLDSSNKNYFKKIHNSIIAADIDKEFSVKRIGISIGNNINENFKFLQTFAVPFDEITLSRDIFNTGMNRYIHNDFKGEPVVPQVIIMKRSYNQNILADTHVNTAIESEKLLYRLVGLPNIEKFTEISDQINFANFFEE